MKIASAHEIPLQTSPWCGLGGSNGRCAHSEYRGQGLTNLTPPLACGTRNSSKSLIISTRFQVFRFLKHNFLVAIALPFPADPTAGTMLWTHGGRLLGLQFSST